MKINDVLGPIEDCLNLHISELQELVHRYKHLDYSDEMARIRELDNLRRFIQSKNNNSKGEKS